MRPALTWRHGVLLLAAVLFLWQLGGHDLWAPDEPYFAEGAREMVVDGQWAVPHVNGEVTTDKPPLFFWLIALLSLVAGEVNSWTARLPSVFAGLATLALTVRLGLRWAGPRTAALAGFVLCTSYMFWEKSRWSQIDALLCCLIWVALSAFAAFREGSADGRRAGLLFWAAAALAVLAKGPVGLLLPLGIALVTLATDRELGRWKRFAPLSGPLLFALLIGAWMALATFGGHGEYSVWGAFREHFLERGLHGMHHKQPPWYYLEALPPNLLPWTGLLPGALVLGFRRRSPADRLLLVTTLFVILFFSISTEKRELYVLPAFPAIALLSAGLVAAVCRWNEPPGPAPRIGRRWVTLGDGIVGGLIALAGLAAAGLVLSGTATSRIEDLPAWAAVAVASALVAGGLATVVLAWRDRPLAATLSIGSALAVAYLLVVSFVYPFMEPTKSARPFALRMAEITAASRAEGLPVMVYDLGNLHEAFAFYTDGVYTTVTEDPAELAAHLERPERVFALVHGGKLDHLPADLLPRLRLVDSTHLARRRVVLLVNGPYPGSQPLPQPP